MISGHNGARGDLFVVSAPSGAGKTTLCKLITEKKPDLKHSISYTTRRRRPGEIDGIDYKFVTEEEFSRMVEEGEFVEWARVHGNYYGTAEKSLRQMLDTGIDALLDIDTQGAKQLREKFPEAVFIFILPPSFAELKKRLTERMSESPGDVRRRLENARKEIREYKIYDYVIVNDRLEDALCRLECIVSTRRASTRKVDPEWVVRNFLAEEDKN